MAQEAKDTVDQRLRALDDDARAYRLIASTTRGDLPMAVRDERRKVGSAVAIGESVYSLMELAARALGSHTCALFLLDPSGKELRVQEMVTRSDLVVTGPIPADKGVLGSVVKRREVVRLHSLRHDFPGITYYHPPDPPTALLAVPVLEGEHLRGVLVCDWKDAREPSAQDASVLGAVAREVIRTVETEAILAQLDLAKQQTDRLFAASREFIGAVTLPQTFEVAIRTARAVSEATAAVLAMREDGKLRVVAADGEGLPPGLLGREVVDDSGLISACMKNQVVLPHGLWEPDRLVNVLGAEAPLKGAQAVRVMPFLEKQESVGVLVVTAPRRNAFPRDVDDRLRVATDMASLSVANARLYARLERMATTDGLTGLLNHRTFQERMTEALQRAERHGRPLGLLLTDIDHFKNVNDTYGHPVGDLVLKNVSAVIKAQARATDTVARYGGEEFAVILEETDIPGGLQMAERIRTAVAASTTDTDMGPLKVTLSLGVAVFPSHGKEKHVIIERADQALYDAKHGGRNRAVVAAPQPPAQEKA
jgi:diguanylate cyclase (GGDEF)-like protein